MMLLVSGATATIARYREHRRHLGHLLVPGAGNAASMFGTGLQWAVDNGAFSGFDPGAWLRCLDRVSNHAADCLFAACPDAVADARRTLDLFERWEGEIRQRGFPVAFVGQDGQESLAVPWERFGAWFVGGSTAWKLSRASADLVTEAKRRGKWVHAGRVNSRRRMETVYRWGADSFDGGQFSMFPDRWIPWALSFLRSLEGQRSLWG